MGGRYRARFGYARPDAGIALDVAATLGIVPAAMKTIFLPLACAMGLAASALGQSAEAVGQPLTGKVLVLENENTLTGDIERVGEQYRVRRTLGETWVPASRVLHLCADMDEAYAFLSHRANRHDPDERLRLARWCRANGLLNQARLEAKAAVDLRPEHAESRRLLTLLEQTVAGRPAASPRTPAPEGPVLNVDLTADCLGTFVTRVQPILMNTCAHCHTQAHPGPFRLTRAYEGITNRKALQQNLAVVLAQVNFSQPQLSPLLTRAVSDHAHVGQAPLRGRQVPAYHMLEDWVHLTLENNPQLRDQGAAPPGAPAPIADAAGHGESTFGAEQPPVRPSTAAAPPVVKPVAAASPAAPMPPDPYDPEDFNRQAHPEKPRGR
jgi:hypothetical protein